MADIRQTTSTLDNFNRANENPIASPWVARFSGSGRGRIDSNILKPVSSSTWIDSWTTKTFDNDACEVWATTWSVADGNEFWYCSLLQNLNGTSVLDGYVTRAQHITGGILRWTISRYDNETQTQLGANVDLGLLVENFLITFRREGSDLVSYSSEDAGANWTERIRRTDSTYTTGLYLGLGTGTNDGTGPGWDNFGGGPAEAFTPQIYRRTY